MGSGFSSVLLVDSSVSRQFLYSLTSIVHPLVSFLSPALQAVESSLESFPLFRDRGVADRRFLP